MYLSKIKNKILLKKKNYDSTSLIRRKFVGNEEKLIEIEK